MTDLAMTLFLHITDTIDYSIHLTDNNIVCGKTRKNNRIYAYLETRVQHFFHDRLHSLKIPKYEYTIILNFRNIRTKQK